jgi:hypothetical protein
MRERERENSKKKREKERERDGGREVGTLRERAEGCCSTLQTLSPHRIKEESRDLFNMLQASSIPRTLHRLQHQ